jgi:UDP-glucuronate 4-epimerase
MEQALGQTTEHEMLPPQPGDVAETFADIEALVGDTGYAPLTSLEQGLEYFANWYRDYYRKK